MNPTITASIVLSVLLSAALLTRAAENPTDDEIRAILRERIDTAKKGVGMVVGVIDEKGTRIVSYGWMDRDKSRAVDGNTVFEIGSVTKVFTSLALANMVGHGEVKLDDPISKYLPKSVKVPTRNGKEITLVDLATHTSGLPRMPDNFTPKDENNPYADYTIEQMYDFLSRCTLTRDIGEKYEYSNFGVGLLGQILARKAGTNYEALVLQRVCHPLGMTNTMITLTQEVKTRLATGHNEMNQPVENWDFPTLTGCGALRSTANDLLKFAAANAGLVKTDLSPAMELAQTPRHDAGSPALKIGLGWHISTKYDVELVWHNGGTGGYHSFVGFNKKSKRCIVMLANSANSIDDIACHLLETKYELQHFEPASEHVAIQLEPKILDGYAGRYQLTPSAFFNVRRVNDRLQVQLTGQSYFDVFPESPTNFFYKVVDAQIAFNTNAEGRATNLVLRQNGRDQTAPKIADTPEKERVAVKIDPKIYDAYAGQYELAPGIVLTVRRDGDRLLVQVTGQSFAEIYPESETDFFYKVVDARITFVRNDNGEVTNLILHQNGDQTAKRMK